MKRAIPFLAIGASLAIAVATSFVVNSRTAEAASTPVLFARPSFDHARAGVIPDLTRYGVLGDATGLAALSNDVGACHDALAAAGVRYKQISPAHATGGCGYDEAVIVQSSLTSW